MSEGMTDAEVKAIRWVEHVLAPLLVGAVLTLATCANQTQDAVADLEAKQASVEMINGETKTEIRDIKQNQDQLLRQQHNIEVNVKRIETHQEHFKQEIQSMKRQNEEILRILRAEGRN